MREASFLGLSPAGFHRVAYTEWGEAGARPPVVCVHGMSRNGRDFDRLAAALGRQVVCPDVVGRGRSDWLPSPSLYSYPQYCADMNALLARLAAPAVDWVGTSMGGLIGLMLAALPGSPIRRLVLNDIGPFVPKTALERLATYVGADPVFEDMAALEGYLRAVYVPFGPLDDAAWRHLARHARRDRPDGRLGLAYDPAIGAVFTMAPIADVDIWALWERVACPVLVLRGAESDLLTADTAARMQAKATVVELPGIGHAPALMSQEQIAIVRDWLEAG